MSLLSFLPSIIGVVGSLFKGKKTKYTNAQTPEQQAAYNQLLKMIQGRMGQQSVGYQPTSDALSMLYKTFLGQNYTPTTTSTANTARVYQAK